MKSGKTKALALLTSIVMLLTLLAGCGGTPTMESSSATSDSESSSSSAEKTKITVATGAAPRPYAYVDDNDELVGYDIDLVRAIFDRLPQYEVTFEIAEFTSIFAGLDSDRYQIGANHFAKNAEREEKYLFSDPDFQNEYVIAVPEGQTDITSLEDLLGKTTEVNTGVNFTTALEEYNKSHTDNPVQLTYTDADMVSILQHVESGAYDFQLIDAPTLETYIKEYGLKLDAVSLTAEESALIGDPYTYLLISKGTLGEQLQSDINTVLAELIADGTLESLSEKYLDGDYTPKQ